MSYQLRTRNLSSDFVYSTTPFSRCIQNIPRLLIGHFDEFVNLIRALKIRDVPLKIRDRIVRHHVRVSISNSVILLDISTTATKLLLVGCLWHSAQSCRRRHCLWCSHDVAISTQDVNADPHYGNLTFNENWARCESENFEEFKTRQGHKRSRTSSVRATRGTTTTTTTTTSSSWLLPGSERQRAKRKFLALVAFPAHRRCPAQRGRPIRKLERDRAVNLRPSIWRQLNKASAAAVSSWLN